MQFERVSLAIDPTVFAQELRALVPAPESVADQVAEIISRVRTSGDDALRYYTRRFDTGDSQPAALQVPEAELDTALERVHDDVREGLVRAIDHVRRVSHASLAQERTVVFSGHEVTLREAPVNRAGVYVPSGRAPYPSTVVMGAVSAAVAGVKQIAVCAPPGRDGELAPVILAACRLAGASVVYRMGGAQAIAALAYGTETVTPVDVIVGPGNLYVQEAKRQVFGQVGIDGFAGPSDLMLIADGGSQAEPLALDLLAQAEHGLGTLVVAVSVSGELLEQLSELLQTAPDTGAVARLVLVSELEHAFALAEAFAPEHLQLVGDQAQSLAPRISRAGCLLVGPDSGTAFSDYIAGSNHVLPTNGAARFASALSPAHFRRRFTEVRIGAGAAELARRAAPVARAESFELHARSMEVRIRDNASDDAHS
jgi:histidinol dehydrogenase